MIFIHRDYPDHILIRIHMQRIISSTQIITHAEIKQAIAHQIIIHINTVCMGKAYSLKPRSYCVYYNGENM